MNPEIIKQIINAGIAAPSADNSQPWLYKQHENTTALYIDETRSGKLSDSRYLLSDIAIGCVAENMLIQARHLGFEGTIHFFPETEEASPLFPLTINFEPAKSEESIPASVIYNRRTDRTFPWKGPIDSTTKQALSSQASTIEGAELLWLNKKQRKTALKALYLAESLRFSNKDLHHELFSSINFNLNWKETSTEHLAPAALNVEFFAKPIFKMAKNWGTMKILNVFGAAKMFGLRSAVIPSILSPELCLVTIDKTDRKSIINAGRAIQRTWLKATEHDLCVHPLASAGVMSLNLFNNKHNDIIKIKNHMRDISNPQHGIVFLRLGTNKHKSPHYSQRRKNDEFIA